MAGFFRGLSTSIAILAFKGAIARTLFPARHSFSHTIGARIQSSEDLKMVSVRIVAFCFLLFLSGMIVGTTGGGQGKITLFAGALFLDIGHAVAFSSYVCFIGQLCTILQYGSRVRWDIVLWYVLPGIVGAAAGTGLFLKVLTKRYGKIVVACSCLWMVGMQFLPSPSFPASGFILLILLGGMNGLMAGFGLGALLRLPALLSVGVSKETVVGTSAVIALILNTVRSSIFMWRVPWHPRFLPLLGAAAIFVPLGVRAGYLLMNVVSISFFRHALLCVLVVEALWFLFQGSDASD